MNRHTIKGKIKRALCVAVGHFPEYEEEERWSQGVPRVPLLARWFKCRVCGHVDGFEVIKRPGWFSG